MKQHVIVFSILCWLFCSSTFASKLILESSAFESNSMIPAQYTCTGTNHSPPLAWKNIPEKTQSLAIVMQDSNAPSGVFTHWILFNIPPTITHLDAGSSVPEGATSAKNNWNRFEYQGPCPNIGTHSYVFTLYALNKVLSLNEELSADNLLSAMTGHVIQSAVLTGLYQKE
jgi:Raf kinase inhibitor-like YbhB/YbcL family protein